jgi:NADH-quinone oxidoreductase subunit C
MNLIEIIHEKLGTLALSTTVSKGEITLEVGLQDYLSVATILRDDAALKFEVLIDLCGVDYLGYGQGEWATDSVSSAGFSRGVQASSDQQLNSAFLDVPGAGAPGRFRWEDRPEAKDVPRRFAVVVHLLSLARNQRLRVKVFCIDNELPVVPSLTELWRGVNWFEREAFDLFGIVFDGHPDLRRILTDYGFVGHPFRKDFPLIGNVEVRYDAVKKRVVYEPVSIEPRIGVPRVVREDSRYGQAQAEAALITSVKV